MSYNVDNFQLGLEKLGIEVTDRMMEQFILFYEFLIEKNKVMNLTGITEWEDVVQKHFLDSLALVRVVDMKRISKVIDVGTGAGFPGIPLKIVFPHLNITLMDSLNKRIKFLQEVTALCRLDGIEAVHSRAEDLARKEEYREQFDICVSRAVANMSSLSEYCLPFVKTGGQFISYKSGAVEEELQNAGNAIKILGGELNQVDKFSLPDSNINRTLVLIDKIKACGKKYPRKAGMATNNPL